MSHLFISETDGALYDTRRPEWASKPLRAIYRRTFSDIKTSAELRATIRAGAFAWPGGYPLVFLCADGECLSFDSARENYKQCAYSIQHDIRDEWRIVRCFIHWEGAPIVCAHSGLEIESAYGETEGADDVLYDEL